MTFDDLFHHEPVEFSPIEPPSYEPEEDEEARFEAFQRAMEGIVEAHEAKRQRLSLPESAAHHEAGHLAIALEFGWAFGEISIYPNEDGKAWRGHVLPIEIPDEDEKNQDKNLALAIAGSVAQARHALEGSDTLAWWWELLETESASAGVKAPEGIEPDFDIVKQLLGQDVTQDALLTVLEVVSEILDKRWAQVEAVVEALLPRKTLSADEVRAIVQAEPA